MSTQTFEAFIRAQNQTIIRERERWLQPDDDDDEQEPTDEQLREIAAELRWESERGQ